MSDAKVVLIIYQIYQVYLNFFMWPYYLWFIKRKGVTLLTFNQNNAVFSLELVALLIYYFNKIKEFCTWETFLQRIYSILCLHFKTSRSILFNDTHSVALNSTHKSGHAVVAMLRQTHAKTRTDMKTKGLMLCAAGDQSYPLGKADISFFAKTKHCNGGSNSHCSLANMSAQIKFCLLGLSLKMFKLLLVVTFWL